MIASELILDDIPTLNHTDSGEKALRLMDEVKVTHLPVLKNNNYVGVVSDSDIYDKKDANLSLDKLFDVLPRPYVFEYNHIYEVMKLISEVGLTVVPILDVKEKYVGATSLLHVMRFITGIGSIKETGSVLILEMNQADYSLAHIAQCVETNNAKVLSSYITSAPNSTKIEITLKINLLDLSHIIRTFERFDYTIKAAYQKADYPNDLQDRYDELMKYLNI